MKHWIAAFRLRTLPLALSSIGMGGFLVAASGHFNGLIFTFCVLTTIFLQILSNLANDYGDTVHGADSADRKGPSRAVQSGDISKSAMRKAIMIFVFLALVSGISLLYSAFGWSLMFWVFTGIGLLAILAAITYTAGYKPYGYAGLGDISVLVFFGFVAVMGSAFLFEQKINWNYILPSLSIGLFSVAVIRRGPLRGRRSRRRRGRRYRRVRRPPQPRRCPGCGRYGPRTRGGNGEWRT